MAVGVIMRVIMPVISGVVMLVTMRGFRREARGRQGGGHGKARRGGAALGLL